MGSCHEERRADAVLEVRDVEIDRLLAELAAVRAALAAAESHLSAAKNLADRARDFGNHNVDLWDLIDALGGPSDLA